MTKAANPWVMLSILMLFTQTVFADWGIFQSFVIIDQGSGNTYYDASSNTVNSDFQSYYFGNLQAGSTFILKGGEIQTFKNNDNGNSNVCGGILHYRIYRSDETPGSFSTVTLNYNVGYGDQFPGNGSTNQMWDETGQNIDLLSGLSLPGNYIVEVYIEAIGSQNGGCAESVFANNGGANYLAHFDFDLTDSFSDVDLSANPVWSGDTGSWTIVADSDVAAGTTGSQTLRLNAPATSQTESISTPFSDWQNNQNWSFFFGRRAQGLTGANTAAIWLYSTEANLESATVDGYRLFVGDNADGDEFLLQSVTDGVATTILTTTAEIPNGLLDFGLAIQVTRSASGAWEVLTSALPAANGDGVVASDFPLEEALTSRGTVVNTDYTPAGTGYFGFAVFHSTGGNAIVAQEFDQIRIKGDNTVVSGCTDNTACNYNASATVDDGSCDFSCYGCTDPVALNFDALATIDDASCVMPNIVITEIHYNPNDGAGYTDANYEFIEIYNAEAVSIDLSGCTFNLGVNFTFPASTTIAAGEYIVIALNASTYSGNGYQVFQFTGGLSNSGETVALSSSLGTLLDSVAYGTSAPWPTAANGSGPSLELADPALDNNLGGNWLAQTINGTPGGAPAILNGCTDPSATNYDVSATIDDGSCTYGPASIVISELHYNPCGDQGNDGDFEFLELFNASADTVVLSSWEILGFEFTFPDPSSIAPGEYIVVVTNGGAVNYPGPYQVFELTATGAAMANTGESIALLDDLGNYIDYVNYDVSSPWPAGANGDCSSLEVIDPYGNNNDPANWQSSYVFGGTPGAPNSQFFECSECGEPGAVSITPVDEDFETGDLSGWTESITGDWIADNVAPINGAFSLKHNLSGVSGSSHISYDMECLIFEGTCTTWQFQFGNGAWTPASGDRFLVYLAASESDLQSATIDGYAVGLNYADNDNRLALYLIQDGAVASTLMKSNVAVGPSAQMGVQVIKDQSGNWMMALDVNGGFDNLFNVSGTFAPENSLSDARFLGVRFDYATAGVEGNLWLDDFSVSQCGLENTWYSVSSGNTSDAIWSTDDLALTGEVLNFGRFKRLVIQDGHTVTMDSDVIADDFSTEPSGTFDGGAGSHKLYLYGNLINDGAVAAGNSNVVFKGDAAQLVGGNALNLYDFTVESNSTVTLLSQLTYTHILYPNKGTLNANGNLVIYSDASTVAYVAPVGAAASIIGDAVHMVHLPLATNSQGAGWGWLAPATTGLTFQDWNDDIVTTGMANSDAPSTPFVNIQWYDESLPGNRNIGNTPETDVNNPIDPNLGYWVYEFNNALDVDMTGPVRQGSILVDLAHTNNEGTQADGWNLVHNMYAAPVDIEALVDNSDLDGPGGVSPPLSYYVREMSSNSYKIYQAISGLGNGSRYLAPFQPIFVFVGASHYDLQFDESVKDVEQSGLYILRNDVVIPSIQFKIEDGTTSDLSILAFTPEGSNSLDVFDAPKMFDDEMTCVASFISEEGEELAIDSRMLPENEALEIPVYVRTTAGGSFSFSVTEISDLPANYCLHVENLLTGETIPVAEGNSLILNFNEAYEGVALKLVAKSAADLTVENVSCNGLNDGRIEVTANTDAEVEYNWFNEEGVMIHSGDEVSASVLENLNFGTYYVEILSGDLLCGAITLPVNINEPAEELITLSSEMASCNLEGSASLIIDTQNVEAYSYNLYNADGQLILSESMTEGQSLVEELNGSIYEIEVTSACTNLTQVVDLSDINAVVASFSQPATSFVLNQGAVQVDFENQSTNANSFQWSFGDGSQSNSIHATHVYTEPGVYSVELFASNGSCDHVYTAQIEVLSETVGLNELAEENHIWVASGSFTQEIHFDRISASQLELNVHDASGRLVIAERIAVSNGTVFTLETSQLSGGLYNLSIQAGSEQLFRWSFVK